MMRGFTGEDMFIELIEMFPKTFKRVKVNKTNGELIDLALKYSRRKVQTLLETSNNSLVDLIKQPQAWLLDRLFNCDCLMAVNLGGKVKLVAVDVTTDPSKLLTKESKMEGQEKAMRLVGIEIGLVVLWDIDPKKLPQFKQWGLQVLKAVKNIDASSHFTGTVILSSAQDED